MDCPITPAKAATFGVLLIALWLIFLGIWNTCSLFFLFSTLPSMGLTVTYATIILLILWQALPLIIGIALFRQSRHLVRLFSNSEERDSWNDASLLAALCVGLIGLFLASRGVQDLCGAENIKFLILEIDNPKVRYMTQAETFWGRLLLFLPIIYPIAAGLVFICGASRFGDLIGHQIDKSLENPADDNEEGEPS
ncbi:MAG: hypothetical protein LBI05_08290 [Planctomycetaceae bacterium]|jgi:hypothetical protein|nr:hypothetical protein [Planctomycetaceae bacterium]